MIPSFGTILFFLPLTILLTACGVEEPRAPREFVVEEPETPLRIGLSEAALSVETIIREIYKTGPNQADLQFVEGNERALYSWLKTGELDVVIVYQPPDNNEGLWFEPIAQDALSIVSHPNVGLKDIGLQALTTLFTGTVDNWSIFGLENQPIVLYSRELGAGSRAIFDSLVMANATISPNTLIATSVSDMLAEIANTPGAIGYTMMGSLGNQIPLAINGIVPSRATVSDGSYPIVTPIYVVGFEQPSGVLEKLIYELLSESGQNLIGEKYSQVR